MDGTREAVEASRVTIRLDRATPEDTLESLSEQTGVRIRFEDGAEPEAPVELSFDFRDAPLEKILALLSAYWKREHEITADGVVFRLPDDR